MRIGFLGDSLTTGVPGCSYVAALEERLAGHALVNLGKGNETVGSLRRRLSRRLDGMRFDGGFDVAVLWIGVNDATGELSRLQGLLNALLGQRRARDLDEFRAHYGAILDLLRRHAGRVIAVAPLLRGEDLDNGWNRRIAALAGAVEALASRREGVEVLDLRPAFAQALAGRPVSPYLPRSIAHVALDALTLRSRAQVDRKAAERGLYLTLDGLHLNGAGAELVAGILAEAIERGDAGM